MKNWTHARQTNAEMVLVVRPAPTIRTFRALAQSVTLADSATKTSTNANSHHRAEMERRAKTSMAPINAFAPKDMKEKIAQ